jgi:hypothetical protein
MNDTGQVLERDIMGTINPANEGCIMLVIAKLSSRFPQR